MKIKQTHKGIGPFFYGIKGMVYKLMCREELLILLFLNYHSGAFVAICYHVTSFAICWLCKNSLFTVSSAAARLPVSFVPVALSEPQKVPVEPRAKPIQPLNETGRWMTLSRQADGRLLTEDYFVSKLKSIQLYLVFQNSSRRHPGQTGLD